MATFEIEETEGVRWVKIGLEDDDVRTERGALNHYKGAILMDVPLPSLQAWWVSLFSDESLLRPRYHGTGQVYLDSSLGGFHVMRVEPGERWILDTKCFWASDGELALSVHREPFWTAYWADQGVFWYKTAVKGEGHMVLSVPGPVEEVSLDDDQIVVDGTQVVAHTSGIQLSMRRPSRSWLSYWMSGQKLAYAYRGTGKLLLCTTPYWRARIKADASTTA